jgi:transposase InsO family protein
VGVTRQGFYAWKRRPPSAWELFDRELAGWIRRVYDGTDGIYGAPRVHAELRLEHGIRVGRKRVARLMRQLGLRGADGRRGGPRTTVRDPKRPSAMDLVDRTRQKGMGACRMGSVRTYTRLTSVSSLPAEQQQRRKEDDPGNDDGRGF